MGVGPTSANEWIVRHAPRRMTASITCLQAARRRSTVEDGFAIFLLVAEFRQYQYPYRRNSAQSEDMLCP